MLLISIEFLPVLRNIIPESAEVSQIIDFENMNDDYNLMTAAEGLFLNQTLSYLNFGWFHSFVVRGILALCKSIPFSSLPAGLYQHGGSLLTVLPNTSFHPVHVGSEIVQLGGFLQSQSLFQKRFFRIRLEETI